MTNQEIIQLLKNLRWDGYTAPDGQVKECRGCSVSYMPGYGAVPKHDGGCRIAQAIRALQPQERGEKVRPVRKKVTRLVRDRAGRKLRRALRQM